MAKKKSIIVYRRKTDEEIKHIINVIVNQLEHYGRATSRNGKAVRILSRHMAEPIRKEQIYFDWNNMHKKSVITLPPSIRLVRLSSNKIKLIFEKEITIKKETRFK